MEVIFILSICKILHNIDKIYIQDEVHNEGQHNNDAGEVESGILETEETEKDKHLDTKLQLLYATFDLSTQETASVREWWRFSYLFDIGKHIYIYI